MTTGHVSVKHGSTPRTRLIFPLPDIYAAFVATITPLSDEAYE